MNVLELTFLQERVYLGIDVHPSEEELKEFARLANLIAPELEFSYRGCQECVNSMVKFVFDNQKVLDEKQPTKTKK
jgi:hypothetical protein